MAFFIKKIEDRILVKDGDKVNQSAEKLINHLLNYYKKDNHLAIKGSLLLNICETISKTLELLEKTEPEELSFTMDPDGSFEVSFFNGLDNIEFNIWENALSNNKPYCDNLINALEERQKEDSITDNQKEYLESFKKAFSTVQKQKNDEFGFASYFDYDDSYNTPLEILFEGVSGIIDDHVYMPIFLDIFSLLCHSVLNSEYTMLDDFSKRLQDIQDGFIFEDSELLSNDVYTKFLEKVSAISTLLSDYISFNIFTDTLIDKDPISLLIAKDDEFDSNKYKSLLNKYYVDISDGTPLIKALCIFFHEFLEMTKIDQNYYFSKGRFKLLLNLDEMINDDRWGLMRIASGDIKKKFGIDIQSILELINVKNEYLIYKICDSCYDKIKDIVYIGFSKRLIFNPRSNNDHQQGKESLCKCKTPRTYKNENITNLYDFNQNKYILRNECDKYPLLKYEKYYIWAQHSRDDNAVGLYKEYVREIERSQTSYANTDIRNYNTKIIEMAKDAVKTAELFVQITGGDGVEKKDEDFFKKVQYIEKKFNNSFENKICFDTQFLVSCSRWCLDFLDKKYSDKNIEIKDIISNYPQIENTLRLTETLIGHIKKLRYRIKWNVYCIPFATKFRGCFYQLKEPGVIERLFVPIGGGISDFEKFIKGSDECPIDKKKVLFIASTFIPPVNFEKLNTDYRELDNKFRTLSSRIHAAHLNYANKMVNDFSLIKQIADESKETVDKKIRIIEEEIKNKMKEDRGKMDEEMEKSRKSVDENIQKLDGKIDDSRKSVIQILGVFSAFITLAAVALTSSSAEKTPGFTILTMFGFSLCIGLFVLLLHFMTKKKSEEKDSPINSVHYMWGVVILMVILAAGMIFFYYKI